MTVSQATLAAAACRHSGEIGNTEPLWPRRLNVLADLDCQHRKARRLNARPPARMEDIGVSRDAIARLDGAM